MGTTGRWTGFVTNHSRLSSLHNKHLFSNSFCGSGIPVQVGWLLCLWVSHKSAIEVSGQWLQPSQGSTFQVYTHVVFGRTEQSSLLVFGQRQLWVPCRVGLSTEQPTTRQVASSEWESKRGQRECTQDGSSLLWPNLGSDIPALVRSSIGSKSLGPVHSQGEGRTQICEH